MHKQKLKPSDIIFLHGVRHKSYLKRKFKDVSTTATTTFIEEYLRHTSIYESPTSFWKWSSYATVSAILRDHCYLRQGDSSLYPNIYILLLAESGGHRKGRPVELSETLVNKINNTKVISGRASVQAILDELARAETDKVTGKILKVGSAIFYAPELAAGIVSDPEALKILTDIYDYKANPYKSRLRTGPCFNLERIVFSMFGASNEDMLRDLFDSAAVKGGLLARTFLVVPNEFRPSNSLLDIDPQERKDSLNKVLTELIKISELKGEFIFTQEAKDEYKSWYGDFRQSYAARKEASGVVGRIHTSIIKLAMVLAANDVQMEIRKEHIERSIDECLSLIPNYSIFTMSHGKSELSQAGGLVITILFNARGHMLPRKTIIRDHWQDGLDADTLEKIIVTLQTGGWIEQEQRKDGMYVKLTDSTVSRLNGAHK